MVNLDCRPEDQQKDLIVTETGEVTAQRCVLQRYRDRLKDAANMPDLIDLSLFAWL